MQLQVFLITSGIKRVLAVYTAALTSTFNIVLQEQTTHEMSQLERRMKRGKEEEKKIRKLPPCIDHNIHYCSSSSCKRILSYVPPQ